MQTDVDFKWQDYASCNGMELVDAYGNPSDPFFEEYETDVVSAMNTDKLCMHCPVAKQCLQDGIDNGDWGVHGGVYLVYGRVDASKNSHKNEEDWKELDALHGYSIA